MEAIGVTYQQLQKAAERAGVRIYDDRPTRKGVRFTLKTDGPDPKYKRLSQHVDRKRDGTKWQRTVAGAVCWHGHRDFFRELYGLAPEAIIKTALATYRGQQHFEDTFYGTREEAPSSPWMNTVPYEQACACGES